MNAIIKTSLIASLIALLTLGLLASCARSPHPMNMTAAIQSAKTKADHEALAEHYEETAEEMENKAVEHEALLREYQREPWRFGKLATGFGNHCQNLIRIYRQAAEENREMAKMHRETAAGMKP
ncbi:MAG TPA: hypothetical protein VNL74_03650 [Methylococcus sp.]|nr:hypothetical protein [Methylococcus sp.]